MHKQNARNTTAESAFLESPKSSQLALENGTYLGSVPTDSDSSYLSLSGYMTKPIFDVVAASAALVVFAPVAASIAVAVKLTSRGPIISSDTRMGKRGKPFTHYSFRTMSRGRSRRLTTLGRALDHTGLWKLPQLVNVLRGDMSVVGPKALHVAETHYYGTALAIILSIKPGILEPRPIPKDDRSYEDGTLVQSELDFAYVADRALGLDMKICIDAVKQKTAGRG